MASMVEDESRFVVCPTCGEKATGYESSRGVQQKVEHYEAWEGGPMLEVPRKQVEYEPDGPFITRLQPCGHRVDDSVIRR